MALLNKFEVAGHSARWMFLVPMEDAIQDAMACIESCVDFKSTLSGLSGLSSKENSGHLLATLPDGSERILVSHFVSRLLASRVKREFVVEAYAMAPMNGAFCGWVLEMDVLIHVEQHLEFKLIGVDGHDVRLTNNKSWECVRFNSIDEVMNRWRDKQTPICGIPIKPTHGCYDFFVLDPRVHSLHCVQVTWSNTHSCKIHFVTQLLLMLSDNGVSVKQVNMMFVVRKGEERHFCVPNDAKTKPRHGKAREAWKDVELVAGSYGFESSQRL